jgi:hypothetical protein
MGADRVSWLVCDIDFTYQQLPNELPRHVIWLSLPQVPSVLIFFEAAVCDDLAVILGWAASVEHAPYAG